jgi:hypothetical protein
MFRRLVAIAALVGAVFLLEACESAPPPQDPTKMVPTNPSDTAAWKKYVSSIVPLYTTPEQSRRAYVVFAEYGEDEDKTTRTIDNIKNFIGRGIAEGTPLLFASPDSKLIGDMVEKAFADPRADLLKGIPVIFIGQKADEERVRTAVVAWGATFIFHEAK